MVDPGGDVAQILKAVRQAGVKILLTHGHMDQADGAAELRETLGVKIEGPHKEDLFLLDNLPESGAKYGMAGVRAVVPDRWLAEGDEVTVGGLVFDIFEAPGHTPGSVVIYNSENRFALVGDALFQGSVGRTDLPRGDHATLLKSIREKILPLGDDVVFLLGHGSAGRIDDEQLSNPLLRG